MEYICLDIECTGLDNQKEDIIEIAAAKFKDGEIIDTFQTFISHNIEIPENIQILTGINPEMTKGAPSLESIEENLREFIGDRPIIGHNINFDLNFLDAKNLKLNNLRIDTLPLSEMIIQTNSYSLEMLSKNFNQKYFPSHRALDDVLANIELFFLIQEKFRNLEQINQYYLNQVLDSNEEIQKIILSWIKNNEKIDTNYQLLSPDKIQNNTSSKNFLNHLVEKENQIIIADPHTIQKKQFKNYTEIYPANSHINENTFLENHNQGSNWILKAKIACAIKKEKPLFKNQLNLRNDEFKELKLYTNPEIVIEKATKYKINYYNFFKLIKENVFLNNFENILFLEPYFTEEYLKSQEIKIYSQNLEEKEQNQIYEFIKENVENYENNYFTNYLITDIFQKNDPRIQSIVTKEINKSDNTNYLIGLSIYNTQGFSINLINENINLNKFEILDQLNQKIQLTILNDNDTKELNLKINSSHEDYQLIDEQIIKDIKSLKQNEGILILSNSLSNIKEYYIELHNILDRNEYELLAQNQSGSKSKILEVLEGNIKPYILICTHHFYLKFQPELNHLKNAYLTKLPFGLPQHFYYDYLKEQDQNQFLTLTLPHCAYSITNIMHSLSQKSNLYQLHMLDDRIFTARWGKNILDHIPNYIRVEKND